ncbi:MAG: pentapeptide repeat-containing protein [Ilumatobacter sp.]|uniref:pentapeptide repeat-containing protein n=1 Tax=Ilumatobacter sp. TaxID=1967498 RepID=UPI00391B0D7E
MNQFPAPPSDERSSFDPRPTGPIITPTRRSRRSTYTIAGVAVVGALGAAAVTTQVIGADEPIEARTSQAITADPASATAADGEAILDSIASLIGGDVDPSASAGSSAGLGGEFDGMYAEFEASFAAFSECALEQLGDIDDFLAELGLEGVDFDDFDLESFDFSSIDIDRLIEVGAARFEQIDAACSAVLPSLDELPTIDPGVFENLDLENLDLGDFDLENFDLGDFDLENLDLGDFDLENLDLGDFDLENLDLGDFDLENLDLGDFDLENLDLGDFDLENLDLGEFDLGEFDLGEFDLENLDLENLDLENFDLENFDLDEFLPADVVNQLDELLDGMFQQN